MRDSRGAKPKITFDIEKAKEGFRKKMDEEKNEAKQYDPYAVLKKSESLIETLNRNKSKRIKF